MYRKCLKNQLRQQCRHIDKKRYSQVVMNFFTRIWLTVRVFFSTDVCKNASMLLVYVFTFTGKHIK